MIGPMPSARKRMIKWLLGIFGDKSELSIQQIMKQAKILGVNKRNLYNVLPDIAVIEKRDHLMRVWVLKEEFRK